ncbi:hypothetical protein [Spirosoma gilvum]
MTCADNYFINPFCFSMPGLRKSGVGSLIHKKLSFLPLVLVSSLLKGVPLVDDPQETIDVWGHATDEDLRVLLGIALAGGLIGFLLMKIRPLRKRVGWALGITGLLAGGVLASVPTLERYGIFEAYNYLTAKWNISQGKAKLLVAGTININKTEQRKRDILKEAFRRLSVHYGFEPVWVGYISTSGMDRYNEVMQAYLAIRNGPNWQQRWQKQVDSILKFSEE